MSKNSAPLIGQSPAVTATRVFVKHCTSICGTIRGHQQVTRHTVFWNTDVIQLTQHDLPFIGPYPLVIGRAGPQDLAWTDLRNHHRCSGTGAGLRQQLPRERERSVQTVARHRNQLIFPVIPIFDRRGFVAASPCNATSALAGWRSAILRSWVSHPRPSSRP